MSDMFADEVRAPTIGDNQPSVTLITGKELSEYLDLTYTEIVARAQALMEKAPQFLVITNDAEDSEATEFLVKLRACWKAAEAARTDEKTPYDDAAGQVHAFFKVHVLDPLGLAPTDKRIFDPKERDELGWGPRITMSQTLYKTEKMETERRRRQEEERRAREEEEKRRREAVEAEQRAREAEQSLARKRNVEAREKAEKEALEARAAADRAREEENRAAEARSAAQHAAAAPAADMTRARGDRGGVSSLRETLDARDIDQATIDLEALRPYLSDKAIEQAVRAYMGGNKTVCEKAAKGGVQPLKGVIFFINHRTSGRA